MVTKNVEFSFFLDAASCWPPTRAGTLAVISCFEEFKGIRYDNTSKKLETPRFRCNIFKY